MHVVKQQYGIFLSSTNDPRVREYRLAAKNIILDKEFQGKWFPVEMDDFTPDIQPPLKFCEEKVLQCIVYIVLLGPFYGSINKTIDLSYTEFEYRTAQKYGLGIAPFILPKEILLQSSVDLIINAGSSFSRQQQFISYINSTHTSRSVSDIEQFKEYLKDYLRGINTT
jgi:hypothetical protein